MKRVLVLGHRGMLGRTVAIVLRERGFEVMTLETRYDGDANGSFIKKLISTDPFGVVNCIGTTPERTGGADLLITNGLMPQHVAQLLAEDRLLVHASSDGVFRSIGRPRSVDERPDASDAYGISKRLGEGCLSHPGAVVLRTSILGLERSATPRGLLSWFLTHEGVATGYQDHLWNGITTLAWAELCATALSGDLPPGIHQPATIPVTKLDLLRTIASVWHKSITIEPGNGGSPMDRRLVPTIELGGIETQLNHLREWEMARPRVNFE